MRGVDVLLCVLQAYFALMNVTVERCYCHDPLTAADTRFLMPETLRFARDYNPLFLARTTSGIKPETRTPAQSHLPLPLSHWFDPG